MIPLTILSVVLLVAIMMLFRMWSAKPNAREETTRPGGSRIKGKTWIPGAKKLVPLNKEELEFI
jgi:flagellar basal body-associated protein FliL